MAIQNITKMFNDDEQYLTLLQLSKQKRYSLEYLLNAASSGKLKAFKIGDDWLTTDRWFEDYQSDIRSKIASEIEGSDVEDNWVEFLPRSSWRLVLLPQVVVILIIFAIFSFSLSWLSFHPDGNKAALAVNDITKQKHDIGNNFLNYTSQVYGFGYSGLSFVFSNSVLTGKLLYSSTIELGQEAGYLATTAYENIDDYKVSDEVVTEKISELFDDVKNRYQDVAGASHIRQQIYYDEWENSNLE